MTYNTYYEHPDGQLSFFPTTDKHTDNLALPDWAQTERLYGGDFSGAMRRIDAHTVSKEVLLDVTLGTGSGTSADIDVSGIDFPAYRFIIIELYPGDGTINGMTIDGHTNMYWQLGGSSYISNSIIYPPSQYTSTVLMAPMGRADNQVRCLSFGDFLAVGSSNASWQDVEILTLKFSAMKGQRIRIIGIQ